MVEAIYGLVLLYFLSSFFYWRSLTSELDWMPIVARTFLALAAVGHGTLFYFLFQKGSIGFFFLFAGLLALGQIFSEVLYRQKASGLFVALLAAAGVFQDRELLLLSGVAEGLTPVTYATLVIFGFALTFLFLGGISGLVQLVELETPKDYFTAFFSASWISVMILTGRVDTSVLATFCGFALSLVLWLASIKGGRTRYRAGWLGESDEKLTLAGKLSRWAWLLGVISIFGMMVYNGYLKRDWGPVWAGGFAVLVGLWIFSVLRDQSGIVLELPQRLELQAQGMQLLRIGFGFLTISILAFSAWNYLKGGRFWDGTILEHLLVLVWFFYGAYFQWRKVRVEGTRLAALAVILPVFALARLVSWFNVLPQQPQ